VIVRIGESELETEQVTRDGTWLGPGHTNPKINLSKSLRDFCQSKHWFAPVSESASKMPRISDE